MYTRFVLQVLSSKTANVQDLHEAKQIAVLNNIKALIRQTHAQKQRSGTSLPLFAENKAFPEDALMLQPGSTLVLATDAWKPQISGVVRTWESVLDVLHTRGYHTEVLCPADHPRTWPLPRYPEIRLAPWPFAVVNRRLDALRPDAVHIATEGPIGIATRRWCLRSQVPFTTSYHTKFAEYAKAYTKLPLRLGYGFLKKIHGPASATLVPTPTIREELINRGFKNINVWTRGVDHTTFRVFPQEECEDFGPGPVFLYAGRLAVEKNLDAFLRLDLPGTKVLVGDGPYRKTLERKYPDVVFTGYRHGEDLARAYASGDCFVFPSLTDTFGVVMIEAMACGLPVAAFPVTGPIDVVKEGVSGSLHEDLQVACHQAVQLPQEGILKYAKSFTWERTTDILLETLVPTKPD